MFRFIHCADLHLDSPLRGLTNREDAPVEVIRSAARRALDSLVALCIEQQVNFVVIAGDVYDGDWQDYSTGLYFHRAMARLHERQIPVYLIQGNHDAASIITKTLSLPPNVIQFPVDHAATYTLDTLSVALHGRGFGQREVRDNLVPEYPDPLPGHFNIGLLHTSCEGQTGHEPYAPCRLEDLVHKGYDYWALGHIHKRQVLHERPYVVYPGNLQGRHVRELGSRGSTLVTVDDDRQVTLEHRAVDVLRWCLRTVNLEAVHTAQEFTGVIERELTAALDDSDGRPIAVRLVLTGKTALSGSILSDPVRWQSEVENAAFSVDPDLIWVEQVKLEVEPLQTARTSARADDAMSWLAESLKQAAVDETFLTEFAQAAEAISSRMGAYAKWEDAVSVNSADDVRGLLSEAQAMLVTLLEQGGGDW